MKLNYAFYYFAMSAKVISLISLLYILVRGPPPKRIRNDATVSAPVQLDTLVYDLCANMNASTIDDNGYYFVDVFAAANKKVVFITDSCNNISKLELTIKTEYPELLVRFTEVAFITDTRIYVECDGCENKSTIEIKTGNSLNFSKVYFQAALTNIILYCEADAEKSCRPDLTLFDKLTGVGKFKFSGEKLRLRNKSSIFFEKYPEQGITDSSVSITAKLILKSSDSSVISQNSVTVIYGGDLEIGGKIFGITGVIFNCSNLVLKNACVLSNTKAIIFNAKSVEVSGSSCSYPEFAVVALNSDLVIGGSLPVQSGALVAQGATVVPTPTEHLKVVGASMFGKSVRVESAICDFSSAHLRSELNMVVGRSSSGSVRLSESSSFSSVKGGVTVQGNEVEMNASTIRAFGDVLFQVNDLKVAEGAGYVGSVFDSSDGSVELRFSGTSCSLKSCSLTAKTSVIVKHEVHRLLQNGGCQIGKLELDMSVQIETRSGGVTLQAEDIALLSSPSTQGQPSFLFIKSAGFIHINAVERVLLTESVRMVSGGKVIISGGDVDVPRVKTVEITGTQIEAGNSTEHAVKTDELKISDSPAGPAILQFDGDLILDIGSGSSITDSSILVSGELGQLDKQLSIVNSTSNRYNAEIEAASGVTSTNIVSTFASASPELKEIWYHILKCFPTADFQKSLDNKFYKPRDPPTMSQYSIYRYIDFEFIVDSNGKALGYIGWNPTATDIVVIVFSSSAGTDPVSLGYVTWNYFTPEGLKTEFIGSVGSLSPVSKFTAFRKFSAPPKKLNFELPIVAPLADWSEVVTAASGMIERAMLAIEPASTVPLLTM